MSNTHPALVYLQNQYLQALNHHENGRLDEAQRIYQSIVKLQPKFAEALHGLGLIALARSNYQ